MIKSKLGLLAAAIVAGSAMIPVSDAAAQNANFATGDLVLFFQNPGGTTGSDQQVYVNLGNASTTFYSAYESGSSLNDITNIGTLLSNTYGAGWASETTLYAGAGAAFSNLALSIAQDGDPYRTFYTTRARNSEGILGSANSVGITIGGTTAMSSTAASIIGQNTPFENEATSAAEAVLITGGQGTSNVPGQNQVGSAGWNGNIPGGVQQQGSASSFGTFLGYSNVEYALDLYRTQPVNNIAGQNEFGGDTLQGLYMGTLLIDNTGSVSFAAVPEPSTIALIGLTVAAAGIAFVRRRNSTKA